MNSYLTLTLRKAVYSNQRTAGEAALCQNHRITAIEDDLLRTRGRSKPGDRGEPKA